MVLLVAAALLLAAVITFLATRGSSTTDGSPSVAIQRFFDDLYAPDCVEKLPGDVDAASRPEVEALGSRICSGRRNDPDPVDRLSFGRTAFTDPSHATVETTSHLKSGKTEDDNIATINELGTWKVDYRALTAVSRTGR